MTIVNYDTPSYTLVGLKGWDFISFGIYKV